MATRKGFSQLSPTYQARILKHMSPEDYDAGMSLRSARGHASTPERPSQAFNQPDNYDTYFVRSLLKGKAIPAEIMAGISDEPLSERRFGDNIGYAGQGANLTTAIFTLAKGYKESDQIGTVTFIEYSLDASPDSPVSDRTVTYHMSEFKELAALAKQRDFIIQVTSVPARY